MLLTKGIKHNLFGQTPHRIHRRNNETHTKGILEHGKTR